MKRVSALSLPRMSLLPRLLLPALILSVGVGCAQKVDRFTLDRVFARAVVHPDVDRGCAVGLALGYPMEAATKPTNPPQRGVLMSDASAALCAESSVREAQLEAARVDANLDGVSPKGLIALIKDAREVEERAHRRAALRYIRAWETMEAFWGPVGESCPKIRKDDEIAYLMGLNAGVNGLLHDRAAGGAYGMPLDTLLKVARGSQCLDDETWWYVPQALRAAAWATVPGSAPDGVDPWELLDEAASKGEGSGIRLARAVQVVIAANNGRQDVVEHGLKAFARSLETTPSEPAFALFDDYALQLAQHESDLLWTRAAGHRTLEFGTLPGDAAQQAASAFESDPFAEDPFAEGAEETPDSDTETLAAPEEDGP